jgi:FixJ family two-component response regulator
MRKLRQRDAVAIADDESQFREHLARLLASPDQAVAMGRRAQEVVRREQGATQRHADVILHVLRDVERTSFPAVVRDQAG